ncbi:MAG: hypothetical protein F2667_12915 [Actinobacteria bacterium]|uniref:Unannotated protein n=1 Tax=freshwater metagenome TaxID=449393 RepID=A0A6J6S3J2_9ZZZZ|nr:hypothetical protein [Actinomycetota bacterium]
MPGRTLIRRAAAAGVLAVLLAPAPAHADSRVSVGNADGAAAVDPTYATTLTVRGSGFQSVRGGHGGVYVFFGTVSGRWRPSQGGATGRDYFYVPDSEAADNQGFQRFVAFPGSDTAASANGGVMTANGSWSARLVVPGAVFEAFDRAGGSRSIDCRRVTCGVITVGAHGVVNANNETFTPVDVRSLYDRAPAPSVEPAASPGVEEPSLSSGSASGSASDPSVTPGGPSLEVDRSAAAAGHVLAFAATGLPAGSQVSAVLDEGAAGAGPFVVGADGQVAGVLTVPVDTTAGTHELRLFGVADAPSVRFAVRADAPTAEVTAAAVTDDGPEPIALAFVAVAAAALIGAVVRLVVLRRRSSDATS